MTPSIRFALLLIFIASCEVAIAAVDPQSAEPALDGTWVGNCEATDGRPLFVAMRINDSDTSPRIFVSIRRKRIGGVPAKEVVIDGDTVSFRLDAQNQERQFEMRRVGNHLDGKVTVGREGSIPLHLERGLEPALAEFKPLIGDYRTAEGELIFVGYDENPSQPKNPLYFYVTRGDVLMQIVPIGRGKFIVDSGAQLTFEEVPRGPARRLIWTDPKQAPRVADRVELYGEEEVSFDGHGARLSGTLYLPTTKGPHSALVFVHGSGPQQRLDNLSMADRFARTGIACLSYDKRGAGKSTGDWRVANFDVLADDVLAGVELLRTRPEIRADKVGLWGVSQAAWIIPLAASRSDHVAFCIPVSGGAVCPAEQELWRRTEYLHFFGCNSVLQDAMRRGVALHFQWEQLFKNGRFPIPPLFEVEALDMYYDAPAVIRNVRQPVLAIFGEMDRLTPPRESAAIWARELHLAGNRDYSIRLFPRATHGILETDGTGNPFEILPERRLAPGYLQTMFDWIGQHVQATVPGGKRNVVDSGPGADEIIESRGMQKLPWYGSAPVQVPLMLACVLASAVTLIGWPAAWLVRRLRKLPLAVGAHRRPIVAGWFVHFLGLAMCVALLAILRFLGDGSPSNYYRWAEIDLWILAFLTLAVAWLAIRLIRVAIREQRAKTWTRSRRVFYWFTAVSVLLWVPYFFYWTWGPLLAS